MAGDSACTDLARRAAGGPDRQECWPGIGRSRLRHLLSSGLCTVKPHCSFPQLRPRLNCCTWDQSPGGHRQLEERAAAAPSHLPGGCVLFCFFFPLHTFKRCEEKYFSCAPWPLSELFSLSVGGSALKLDSCHDIATKICVAAR